MKGEESEEKKLLLQQYAGYVMTSSMYYDKAMFLVGDGGNGKSTFIDTIGRVIGSNAVAHIDLESLYGQYGMKGLIGKRLNIIEEVHGNYYQSNKLKKLVSGEEITIDIKYKDQFTFRPQCKFVFAVNQMPRVDDTSTATERRVCAVIFKNNFRLNPDTTLRSELGSLYQERSGILNWMIAGLDSLRAMGKFMITQEQTKLLSEYRQENSSVEGFIVECLEVSPETATPSRLLYDEYKKYCVQDGRKFKACVVFTKEMVAYGERKEVFKWRERTNGHESGSFVGVKLTESWRNASGLVPNYYKV
jgi:putative DNA primase/helicase